MNTPTVEHLNRQRIIPKLRRWTLGENVDLRFAVCDWFVSDIYVYLSLVSSACYHWWICLLVWLLSSFLKKLFFILIIFNLLYFSFLFFFLSFFLHFLMSRVADRVLVLRPGVKPVPLRWESRVQDIGLPETSWPHVISIGKHCLRDLHLNAKTQLHPRASSLQSWTPHS